MLEFMAQGGAALFWDIDGIKNCDLLLGAKNSGKGEL